MEVLIGIGKVLLSLFFGLLFTGIFACFSGESNIDNVHWFYVVFCIIIGIAVFVYSIYILFNLQI